MANRKLCMHALARPTCLLMHATKARVLVRPKLMPRLLKLMRRNSGAENLISVGWLVGSLHTKQTTVGRAARVDVQQRFDANACMHLRMGRPAASATQAANLTSCNMPGQAMRSPYMRAHACRATRAAGASPARNRSWCAPRDQEALAASPSRQHRRLGVSIEQDGLRLGNPKGLRGEGAAGGGEGRTLGWERRQRRAAWLLR